jgi:hypothetical protein
MVKGTGIGCWLFVLVCLAGSNALWAADREQREFVIYVNGKEAGQSTMVINQQDDGVTYLTANLNVKFQQLVLSYTLAVEAAEWWRDGRLVGLKSSTTENGKKSEVVVSQEANQLRARINGQDRNLRPETWTSSFWKLPDAKYHNKNIPVFEVDTGKEYSVQLQLVGTEQLTVMNRPQSCFHFRLTGGPGPVDLWYDQYHRLVRQESVELGHKTIVQMVNVRR